MLRPRGDLHPFPYILSSTLSITTRPIKKITHLNLTQERDGYGGHGRHCRAPKPSQRELPDCSHPNQPVLIYPSSPTPKHSLYLSNLDDRSLGSPLYKKFSLDYYLLARRLRDNAKDGQKLKVYSNGEGVVFAEALMDISGEGFLELSKRPNSTGEDRGAGK
ncbi:hypothetical protein CIPAW_11G021500 [Carya illinoinensis]|uniref:Uncharacterized protein n=1 Tax=Carya illinoinensis TaxID=32201 RepID=A0A8T1NU38_CARIL|nr:hypothetical protein CIPAW_11G021500 [Carya illinoinensis]